MAGHPKNIIFLSCDAFGVLPPIAKLTPEQAMYHFISGYTAKVAGTERGVTEPTATFSACFGAAFLTLHPTRYAELLKDKLEKHSAQAWIVNSGWSGGPYGVGRGCLSRLPELASITSLMERSRIQPGKRMRSLDGKFLRQFLMSTRKFSSLGIPGQMRLNTMKPRRS